MATVIAKGIEKRFAGPSGRAVQALEGIDLTVGDGEFVCLLGPSGCGKSTLLNIVVGLETADDGEVSITSADGRDAVVAYMFQESRLLPWMTVEDNLHFVLDAPVRERNDRVAEWLERVGLERFGRYYPRQLSTGMQQRVAVARALIVQPDVLLMDEPFSSLDEITAMGMRDQLLALWHELACSVLFVTHNPFEAALLGDRVLVMTASPGRITKALDHTTHLPRPRDPDDARIWEASREAVHLLRGEASVREV